MNRMRIRADYESDFAAWCAAQARAAREGRLEDLDLPNVAEELDSLGNEQRHRLESHLFQLLKHLLKYEYQPSRRSKSWLISIRESRRGIAKVIRSNPSLAKHPARALAEAYADARGDAAIETDLPERTLPAECPFTLAQLLDTAWLPE